VAGTACPSLIREWIPMTHGAMRCDWHRSVAGRIAIAWPVEYRAWAAEQGLLEEIQDPAPVGRAAVAGALAARTGSLRANAANGPRIVSPPSGATYLKDPTLRDEFQRLSLRAEASASSRLRWSIDGTAIGEAEADAVVRWTLVPGRHTVAVRDGRGREDRASFVVR
jgi:membrane carboxypeptidase/penicillin-binding protein PbpC